MALQAEHVPRVLVEVGLLHRHDRDAELARVLGDDRAVDVLRVLQARAEAPVAADLEAAVDRLGGAGARALAGDDRPAVDVGEDLLDGLVAEVRGAGADRQPGGHEDPAGGRLAVRHGLDDLEGGEGVELQAAERLRHPQAVEAGLVQRVVDVLRELPELLALGRLLVGELRDLARACDGLLGGDFLVRW